MLHGGATQPDNTVAWSNSVGYRSMNGEWKQEEQTPSMRRSGSRQHRVSSHRAVKCECVVFGREHDHSRPEQLDPVSIRTYVRLRAVWILAAFSGERGSEAASL